MVVGVADALELNLLPSLQALLNENLWCEGECALCQFGERFLVGADARAESAEGVSRANHDREAYLACCLQRVLHVLHGVAYRSLQTYLVQLLHKKVSVFSVHNCFNTGAENLNAIFLKRAVLIKLCSAV